MMHHDVQKVPLSDQTIHNSVPQESAPMGFLIEHLTGTFHSVKLSFKVRGQTVEVHPNTYTVLSRSRTLWLAARIAHRAPQQKICVEAGEAGGRRNLHQQQPGCGLVDPHPDYTGVQPMDMV